MLGIPKMCFSRFEAHLVINLTGQNIKLSKLFVNFKFYLTKN